MQNTKKNPWSEFSQTDYFEHFLNEDLFTYKKMFGGLALYLEGRMIAVLAETDPSDPEARIWRGKDYGFAIWNGVLLPTEREYHLSLQSQWPALIPHPVLPKWLYLNLENDGYEKTLKQILKAIQKRDLRLGIEPKPKKKKKTKKTSTSRTPKYRRK